MAMAEEEFDEEEFEEWVKQGLKISHGMNLDRLVNEEDLPSFYPTAPVAFAFVTDVDAIDAEADPVAMAMVTAGEISVPAMIPLPLNKLSVSGVYLGPTNSVNVRLRASWTVRFVKPHSSCHFVVALPVESDPPYTEGFLKAFRFKVSNSSQPAAPPYSTKEPMFGDVHFVWQDHVNGGGQVSVDLSYMVRYSRLHSSNVSLLIMTRLPFYANGFRGERNGDYNTTNRKLKLRLHLNVEEDKKIEKYDFNVPFKVITEEKSVVMLLHESQGPHVEWPDADLRGTFAIAPAEAAKTNQTTQTLEPEAAKSDQTTHQSLEPQNKKIRLTN